jgi:hypothetical protein
MSVKKENVFSLIGRGRYHSCLLSTFSFDFYFFEMKVLRWLHSQGIRNVHLYIDGNYLNHWMKNATGDEMKFNPGYTILPMFGKKVFHPKFWFLTGQSEGLLIIGSGNLTPSGHGGNVETWSAFHFSDKHTEYAPLFAQAWEYTQHLAKDAPQIVKEKTTAWLLDQSPWLAELPKVKTSELMTAVNGDQIALLWNKDRSGIFTELNKHIKGETIINILTLSPFYDKNGEALKALSSIYPNATIDVICDERGQIPTDFRPSNRFSFYDLQSVSVANEETFLVHSKILLLTAKNGNQFLLLGSPNISMEGLGINDSVNANAELAILVKRLDGDLLKDLGIKLKTSSLRKLSAFSGNVNDGIYQSLLSRESKVNIVWAELYGDTITITTNLIASKATSIVLVDCDGFSIEELAFSPTGVITEIKIDFDSSQLHRVALFNGDKAVSNWTLIHHYELIIKTHPNPQAEELENIHQQIQSGDLTKIIQLLQFVPVDLSEDDFNSETKKAAHSTMGYAPKPENKLPLVDIDKFKLKGSLEKHFEKSLANSTPSKVLDILRSAYSNPSYVQNHSIHEDEQVEDISTYSGNEENEVIREKRIVLSALKKEQKAVLRYLNNLSEYYSYLLDQKDINHRISITELTKYLIALELLIEYTNKVKTYSEESKSYNFVFLPIATDLEESQVSLQRYLLELNEKFLLLALHGFKTYELPYTVTKLQKLKTEALSATLFCISNVHWTNAQKHYEKLLIFNTIHYLGLDIKIDWNDLLEKEANIRHRQTAFINRDYYLSNQSFLKKHLLKVYSSFSENMERSIDLREKANSLNKQCIIFSSRKGFCSVFSVKEIGDIKEVRLARPGFGWDKEAREFVDPETIKARSFIKVMN